MRAFWVLLPSSGSLGAWLRGRPTYTWWRSSLIEPLVASVLPTRARRGAPVVVTFSARRDNSTCATWRGRARR